MSVNPAILKRDVDKWHRLITSIKNHNLDKSADEVQAFNVLTNAFQGNFDKDGSKKLINDIKDNINKYASNRDLQTELKDFATVCTLWLTKTDTEFLAFKTALNPPEKETVVEDKKSEREDTRQINPILLNRDVEKFRKLSFSLNGEFESLDVEDQSAFEVLSKYYNRDFDKTECEELINGIKNNLNKYSSNRDLQADLKDFAALCTVWYTKTNYEFTEFKKAMGGKERKPIIVEKKKEEEKKEERKNTNQVVNERIDYTNGDYYMGDLLNGQFHGKGIYYWANGSWYNGDWQNGVQHGKGTSYIVQYKRTDTGTYKDGERFGSGKMVWANGDWYEGGWNDNGAYGKGTRYYKDMQRTDIGDFVSGERNGRGVMKWDNGDRYEGTWKDTVNGLNGEGTYYNANGYSERGRYVNGKWQSLGSNSYNTNTYNNTPTYDGNWLQNAGAWIWNNLKWLPWIITAFLAIIMLIADGFSGSFIGICVGGAIGSFIMMFVIEIIKGILMWLWDHKWIVVVVVLSIFARVIYVSDFAQNLFDNKSSTEQSKPTSLQPNYYCTATSLNVRATPSQYGAVLGKLSQNEEIYVYPENISADFAKIAYQGDIGYVSKQYISRKGEIKQESQIAVNVGAINVPKTKSVISSDDAYNQHVNKRKLSTAEWSELKIDQIASLPSKKHIARGKTVLKKDFGRLETILIIEDDHATYEYLVSYDAKGNYIDCLEIGLIMNYAGDVASSMIEGDKIFRQLNWSEPAAEYGTVYTNYQITPQLTFKEIKKWDERHDYTDETISDQPSENTSSSSSTIEKADTPTERAEPKGNPWTAMPTNFATSIARSYAGPCYSFSDGKHVYVVLSTYGGLAPVLKYNISTNDLKTLDGICPDVYNTQRNTQPYVVVDNIVYLSVAKKVSGNTINTNNGTFWALERFDLETGKAQTPVISSKKAWSTYSDAMLAFTIGSICYFIFDNHEIYTYNTETGKFNQKKKFDKEPLFSETCAAFSVDGKAYLVTNYGLVFEYQQSADTWIKKKNMPNFPKKIHGFSIGDNGYIWGGDAQTGNILCRYNPKNDSWNKCAVNPSKKAGQYKMAFAIDDRYAVLGSGPSQMECFIYDSYKD